MSGKKEHIETSLERSDRYWLRLKPRSRNADADVYVSVTRRVDKPKKPAWIQIGGQSSSCRVDSPKQMRELGELFKELCEKAARDWEHDLW